MASELLDERLEWPHVAWQYGGRWRLGHGLTVVGPGWWPLVRRAFGAVAEVPGAEIRNVRQRAAVLEIRPFHPDADTLSRLRALATELTEASRIRCEGCGCAVPRLEPDRGAWRNHCDDCAATLAGFAGARAERRLWELRAGRCWPASDFW
jgi:hypothetical protein